MGDYSQFIHHHAIISARSPEDQLIDKRRSGYSLLSHIVATYANNRLHAPRTGSHPFPHDPDPQRLFLGPEKYPLL